MSDSFWVGLFGFLGSIVSAAVSGIAAYHARKGVKQNEELKAKTDQTIDQNEQIKRRAEVAIQQNQEIKAQAKEILDATNGLQETAIIVNRDDAAARAILQERERVAAAEKRLEEIRGQG